jgi:AcrR family transcriptional regulator
VSAARARSARRDEPERDGGAWSRASRRDQAAQRILDAAEKVFVERGVSAAGMAEIAEAAGCSRGTLYRYFPSRHALHLAYVDREALRIVRRVRERIAGIDDPRERAVEWVLSILDEVRAKPGTAAWFEPGASGMAARMSRASEVIASLTEAVGGPWLGAGDPVRARWLVRIVVSLLADPEEDEAAERALVERFVAPALLGP